MNLKTCKFKLLPVSTTSKIRIGIMGGSFNPAHVGHRYISLEAIKRFKLNKIIWFVTPKNPLKLSKSVSYEERLNIAKKIASHPKIIVSDFEKNINSLYSITLVKRLKKMYSNANFAYIIGGDNAILFNKWKRWKEILKLMPLIIFDRESFHKYLKSSKIVTNYPHGLIISSFNKSLSLNPWYFIKIRKNPQSSTKIRYEQSKNSQQKIII